MPFVNSLNRFYLTNVQVLLSKSPRQTYIFTKAHRRWAQKKKSKNGKKKKKEGKLSTSLPASLSHQQSVVALIIESKRPRPFLQDAFGSFLFGSVFLVRFRVELTLNKKKKNRKNENNEKKKKFCVYFAACQLVTLVECCSINN